MARPTGCTIYLVHILTSHHTIKPILFLRFLNQKSSILSLERHTVFSFPAGTLGNLVVLMITLPDGIRQLSRQKFNIKP